MMEISSRCRITQVCRKARKAFGTGRREKNSAIYEVTAVTHTKTPFFCRLFTTTLSLPKIMQVVRHKIRTAVGT